MKRAELNHKTLVIDILSASFDENRSVNYVVKQDKDRRARVRALMAYSFKVCHAFGEVWISEDEQACALILYPDKKRSTLSSIIWDVQLAFSVIGLTQINAVLKRESRIKAYHPKEHFSYLWFVGVSPSSQGLGIGSQFLKEIINHSNSLGRPIYLETSVARNLGWYQKHGFEVYKSLDFTYTLRLLRRNPH